mgnify:FL=1
MLAKLPTISRILLGLLFLVSGVAKLMGAGGLPPNAAAQNFMLAMVNSHLLSIVMVVELVCGAALLTGFFAPLALVVLSPIVVVISWFHLTLDPEKWPMGVVLPALMFMAAHGYRTLYLPLLQARPSKG